MQVTPTSRGTHVVYVRNFSTLRREHCGEDGSVNSPAFTVGGLHWVLRYYPDGDCEEAAGHVSAYVELETDGAAAWAYVGLLILNQATGLLTTAFFDEDPSLFDASSEQTRGWGASTLALRGELLASGHVGDDDCLTIECVIHVCVDRLSFPDPPPRDADDMPPEAVDAFLHFVRTDTLPLVAGTTGEGYRDVLRHLLLAGERYGMPRLAAICERLLCRSLAVESVAETLDIADRYGFERLREACVDFASDRFTYALVRQTQGFPQLAPHLIRELLIKFFKTGYGIHVVYDERTNLPVEVSVQCLSYTIFRRNGLS